MANKKINLPNGPGTDSRGNISVSGGQKVLDLSEFDDLFGPDPTSKKETPFKEFISGVKGSFKGRLDTNKIVRNFLRSAAPNEISGLFGTYNDLKGSLTNIKDSLESTNANDLNYLLRRTQNYLPQLKDYLPSELYKSVNKGLEESVEKYEYAQQSNINMTAIRAAMKAEREDSEVKQALDQNTMAQKVNFQKSERAATMRHKSDQAERGMRDIINSKRFDYSARAMGMAVDRLTRINSYHEQFDYGIKRKGLELQFRTFMGIKDLVKLTETNIELQMKGFEQLVRNTGMPDFKKGGQDLSSFNSGQQSRGGIGAGFSSAASRSLQQYLGGFGGNVEKSITNKYSSGISQFTNLLRMSEGGPNLWDQRYSLAGQGVGNLLGWMAVDEGIPMLGRKFRPGANRLLDKYGKGRHNQLNYLMDNIPAYAQEFVQNSQNQHGIKGLLHKLIAPHVQTFGLQDRLKSGTYQTIDQQASFNQLTQRSIVDTIPRLLEKQLQELRMIRTGREDIQLETFDVTTGKFTVAKDAQENLRRRIIPDRAIQYASSTINDALNKMDESNSLSPGARQALAERMLREASTNKRFDPEAYLRSRGYADGTSGEITDELNRFMRDKFSFNKDGKLGDTANNHKLRQEWSEAFLDIRSISRDPYKEIERLISSGHTEPLRMMGIIITVEGMDKINYPRIWEILRGQVSGSNPYGPNGPGYDPTRPDNSGTYGHRDFMGPTAPSLGKQVSGNLMQRAKNRYSPEIQKQRQALAQRYREMRRKYGPKAAEMMEQAEAMRDQVMSGYGQATSYASNLAAGFNMPFSSTKYQSMSAGNQFYNQAMDKMNSMQLGSKVQAGLDKATDLCLKGDLENPLIKGIDFINGSLIDANTKKTITKPSDITGAIINRAGLTVATAAEVASGLYNRLGEKIVKPILARGNEIFKAVQARYNNLGNSPLETAVDNAEDPDKPQDLTLGLGGDTVITARGIEMGEYFNKTTGKVVTSMRDLAGDIVDKSGEIVITAREAASELFNALTGKRYRLTKGFKRVLGLGKAMAGFSGRTTTNLVWGAMKFGAQAALGIGSRLFNSVVPNQNAYLPGEEEPVITRRALLAGDYFDQKGKVIENFTSVYSPIYDKNGEPVIAKDDYKELLNRDGTKHVLAKNQSIWGKTGKRAIRAITGGYARWAKNYWKGLGKFGIKAGGWLGRKTLGGSAAVGRKLFNSMFEKIPDEEKSNPTNMLLAQILGTLQEQTPVEDRKGSWQDQMKRKFGLGDNTKPGPDGKKAAGGFGLLGSAFEGLKKLFGKKQDEEEDDSWGMDDLADAADIADSADDMRDRRSRRRGRGRMGKMGGAGGGWWSKLKNSKMLKTLGGLATGFAGSRVGQVAISAGARILAPIAVGIAGLLSLPAWAVVAGAVVVGGTGYMAWRWNKTRGDFKSLRMEQYGIDSTGDILKVLELEKLLEKYADKNSDNPSINIQAAGGKEVLEVMGISVEEPAEVMSFSRWLESRFKPIFLAYCRGLYRANKSNVALYDIDDEVPDEMKADLLEAVKFPYSGDTPYSYTDNPFNSEKPLEDNTKTIQEHFEELEKKFGEKKTEANEKTKAATPSDGKATDAGKAVAATGAAAGTGLVANRLLDQAGGFKVADGKVAAPGDMIGAGIMTGALGGRLRTFQPQKAGRQLTSLQAIRMRAYGLQTLGMADVTALLNLEYIYSTGVIMSEGRVDYSGDFQVFIREAGSNLGKSTAIGSDSRMLLTNWLVDRFCPAFRSYYGAVKRIDASVQLQNFESKLSKTDEITVANAMMGATDELDNSIWEANTIFELKGSLEDLRKLAEVDLNYLRELSDKDIAGSPTQKASDQAAGNTAAQTGGSWTDSVVNSAKSAWDSTKSTVSDTYQSVKSWFTGESGSGNIAASGGGVSEGGGAGGEMPGAGVVYNSVAAGNGGKWEDVPMPKANGTLAGAKPTMEAAAKMVGLPVELMYIIAFCESGFDYTIKAKPSKNKRTGEKSKESTAYGWFQFVGPTWDFIYPKIQQLFGAPPDDGQRSMRRDPRLQALAGAYFIKGNYDKLKKALKREITDTDIYIAHFLGGGGAVRFLSADPKTLGIRVFPDESESNLTIFYVDGERTKPRTIGQIYQIFENKIAGYRKSMGMSGGKAQEIGGAEAVAQSSASGEATVSSESPTSSTGSSPATKPASPGDIARNTGAGIGGSTAPSSPFSPGDGPSGSSNSGYTAAQDSREAQATQAMVQDTRRNNQISQDRITDQAAFDINKQMLEELKAIRQFTKATADNTGQMLKQQGGTPNNQGQPNSPGATPNNSMTSRLQGRPAIATESELRL